MKKILIVNNNMKVGGVQKSLYNLLWSIDGKYDITLLLFRAVGEYVDQLPPSVRILECKSWFRYLGISQGECKTIGDRLKRGTLAVISKSLGRAAAMKLLLLTQKRLPETYDCAISFLHNGRPEAFYGGTQDFVLHCVSAEKKVAFLHCDYGSCGANNPENNRMMAGFDVIAACSDGCRQSFTDRLPEFAEKSVTVRNFHRIREIQTLACQEPVCYDSAFVNIVMVSRLSHEKGIDRAVQAVAGVLRKGASVRLHIIGGGPKEKSLRELAEELEIRNQVIFYGEQGNPYRFMKNADLFLLTSYHEAAPMVLDEARCLGLPVLTTRTTSSREMVEQENSGWVCDNNQDALEKALGEILRDTPRLKKTKERLLACQMDNQMAMEQFVKLIEG